MEGHAHISVMFALDVIAIVFIAHFLARTWSGLRSDMPSMKGLSYVA